MADSIPPVSHYIHGNSPEEQERLSVLNELLNTRSIEKLEIQPDWKILDVGSGLGQFTRAMARRLGGTGKVIGIERDSAQLATARLLAEHDGEAGLVEFRQGDAMDFPLQAGEMNSFDLVHTRFLLEHVPHPQEIILQMVSAAKPGGQIVVLDDEHSIFRAYPEPPGLSVLWEAYIRSFDRLGNDPLVGRRLAWMLHQAGLKDITNDVVFFGSCHGMANFQIFLDNLIGILVGARSLMIEQGLIEMSLFDRGIEELRTWGDMPGAAFWYTVYWASGVKAGSDS